MLTGWWFYPSWKLLVNGKDYSHILWKNKSHVPNHQTNNMLRMVQDDFSKLGWTLNIWTSFTELTLKKNILVGMIVINKPECHLSFGYKVFDNKWNRPCAVSWRTTYDVRMFLFGQNGFLNFPWGYPSGSLASIAINIAMEDCPRVDVFSLLKWCHSSKKRISSSGGNCWATFSSVISGSWHSVVP